MSKVKSELTKEQQQEVKREKVNSMCRLLANGDYATLKFVKTKLTQMEWNVLVETGKITKEQADYCIANGMLSTAKAAEYKPRQSRWTGSPVEELGKKFDLELKNFLEAHKPTLLALSAAGFDFHPQFRNAAKVGTRSTKKESVLT